MSKTIPHRDLRNRSSEVLREVEAGETFTITNHGVVVAILAPAAQVPEESLRLRPARRSGGFSELHRVTRDHPMQQALDELRGDA